MKTTKMLTILVLALAVVFCQAGVSKAKPMGTDWTYQGRLVDANLPADGIYDFRFKLFDELSDGNQVGIDVNAPDVDVIDGYFTVALDFNDVGVFNGDARWLEIGVRPGDSTDPNDFVTLSPRQEVTPTPYALNVKVPLILSRQEAGSVIMATNNAGYGGIGVYGEAAGRSGHGVYGKATGDDSSGVHGEATAEDGTGVLGYASGDASYGVAGSYISRTIGRLGGVHYGLYGQHYDSGNYGYIGSDNYGVYGYSSSWWGMAGSSDSGVGVSGESSSGVGVKGLSDTGVAGYFIGPENDGTVAALVIKSGTQIMLLDGNEIDAISGDKKLYLNYNNQGNVILNANGGNVGIGETNPSEKLQVAGNVLVDSPGSAATPAIQLHDDNTGLFDAGADAIGFTTGGVEAMRIEGGNVGIGTTNPTRKLVVRGNILVQSEGTGLAVLELGEGLDYAEGFDVTEEGDIEPGTVLVIDADNPGKLTVSQSAYDSKVAGIVAGANGMGSGVRLGVGQFDQDVALAGRVYCKVDATEAAVQPGDLLTTSATSGHAMKATDYGRANGTILGKAMEKLEKGQKGQILVLVTLQ